MVGVKRHVKELQNQLKAVGVEAVGVTEFVQGKTMRWGLAWTFNKSYAANLAPPVKAATPIEALLKCPCSLSDLVSFLKDCLIKLDFKFVRNDETDFEVLGERNTWSHQRRRRREQRFESKKAGITPETTSEDIDPPSKVRRTNIPDSPMKDTTDSSSMKPLKESSPDKEADQNVSSAPIMIDLATAGTDYALHFAASLEMNEKDVAKVSLCFKGGCLGKDGVSQVLQYLKNALDKHQF